MKIGKLIQGRGGFTLLELLVSIAVLSISLSLVLAIYSSVFSVVEQVDSSSSYQNRTSLFIDQLHNDLYGVYKGKSGFFRAQTQTDSNGDTPLLEFTTSSQLRFRGAAQQGMISVVRYNLIKSGKRSNYSLYRTEVPFLFESSHSGSGDWKTILVCERIDAVRLSFKDRYGEFLQGWEARSSLNSDGPEDNRFPTLVRMELELTEPDGGGTGRLVSHSIALPPWNMTGGKSGGDS